MAPRIQDDAKKLDFLPPVVVNLMWCRPGRVGGAEEYLIRQLVGIKRITPDAPISLLVPREFPAAHPELREAFRMEVAPRTTDTLPGRLIDEARWLPGRVAQKLVHHANGTVPPRSPAPIVLTIHDLQHREFPEYFSTLRLAYLRWMLPKSARRASVITVPSEFVARSVSEAFDIDPDRIAVVPHGFEPTDPRSRPAAEDLRSKYGLIGRRILVFPAATFPHKGHLFLSQLMAGPLAREDLTLVFLGGPGRNEALVMRAIDSLGLQDRVVRLGRVPSSHRDGLIAMADALVFPSEYEGFGAPILEAMALHTPVICSDRAALPEVAGDAAKILPLDLDSWADAIIGLATWRDEMVERGHQRSASFSVEGSGRALASAYNLAASRAQ